jgi:hypothetical protein
MITGTVRSTSDILGRTRVGDGFSSWLSKGPPDAYARLPHISTA